MTFEAQQMLIPDSYEIGYETTKEQNSHTRLSMRSIVKWAIKNSPAMNTILIASLIVGTISMVVSVSYTHLTLPTTPYV